MRISRSSAVWKSAYAILCQASEPHGYVTVEDFMREYSCSREEAEERYDTMLLGHAAQKPRKDEGTKPPVSNSCDDCGADVGACGCKNMATADDSMQPGPELRRLLELFAQEVYQKGIDELKYEELATLRDMLVQKQEKPPVYEI